jgi:hypothetical protein
MQMKNKNIKIYSTLSTGVLFLLSAPHDVYLTDHEIETIIQNKSEVGFADVLFLSCFVTVMKV